MVHYDKTPTLQAARHTRFAREREPGGTAGLNAESAYTKNGFSLSTCQPHAQDRYQRAEGPPHPAQAARPESKPSPKKPRGHGHKKASGTANRALNKSRGWPFKTKPYNFPPQPACGQSHAIAVGAEASVSSQDCEQNLPSVTVQLQGPWAHFLAS